MPQGRDRRRQIGSIVGLLAFMVAVIVAILGGNRTQGKSVRIGSPTPAPTTRPPGRSPEAVTSSTAPVPAPAASTTPTTTIPPPAKATTTTSSKSTPTSSKSATTTTTTVAGAGGCPSSLAAQLANTGGGTQLMTVQSTGLTSATVTLWQRSGSCWSPAAGPWPARVGVNGLSAHHHEGDGTTPIGDYGIAATFYGIAPDPGVHGSYHQLVCGDWWDEDPSSPQYNTFQHVACGSTPPFGGGSEKLWATTVAYQHFALVDYNTGPVIAGAGSAIFIHDDVGGGTNGCVSLAPANLDHLLTWLQPGQSPHIVIGSASDIRQY